MKFEFNGAPQLETIYMEETLQNHLKIGELQKRAYDGPEPPLSLEIVIIPFLFQSEPK